MTSTWNTEYYDILSFFYWEPQHLGKIKKTDNKLNDIDKVISHLKSIEVSLNHQFNLFLQLLPRNLYLAFFRSIIPDFLDDNYHYQSRGDREKTKLGDVTQPDIYFIGNQSLLAVELKVTAKTSYDQILKYAMLFYFEQKHGGMSKICNLVFFGPSTFSKLFDEKIKSIEELKSKFSVDMLPDITRKGGISLINDKEGIIEVAKAMSITFTSYSQIHSQLKDLKAKIDSSSPYSDTPLKLIDGMLNELEIRNLHLH